MTNTERLPVVIASPLICCANTLARLGFNCPNPRPQLGEFALQSNNRALSGFQLVERVGGAIARKNAIEDRP